MPKNNRGGSKRNQGSSQNNPKRSNKASKRTKTSDNKSSRKVTKQPSREDIERQEESRKRMELILRSKYQNPNTNASPSDLETQICQYLVDTEATQKELKIQLRKLGIVSARQEKISETKNAIIVFVPFKQRTRWQKIQDRMVRELEKKYSGQDVIFVAQRKVMKLNEIKNNVPRPRNQTITSVHEELLNDIVFPTRIVGKRTRFRVGGKRILKVYLDPKDSKEIESRLPTYEHVYTKLTKKIVKFMFPKYVI